MSYQFANSLFDTREEAITCLVEEFLWAGGLNDADDVIAALRDRVHTINELIEMWDLNIACTGSERDEATRDEINDVFDAIIAIKYADTEEDARLVYEQCDLEEIEEEDPSLIVRVNSATIIQIPHETSESAEQEIRAHLDQIVFHDPDWACAEFRIERGDCLSIKGSNEISASILFSKILSIIESN